MRYLTVGITMVVLIMVAFILVAGCGVWVARSTPPDAITVPDAAWLPGARAVPNEATCFFDRYPELYCENADKSLLIRYNTDLHEISYTRQRVQHITTERLIVAWGKPHGAEIYPSMAEIWWTKCYAISYTTHFSPVDEPEYIMWDDAPMPSFIGAWQGFKSD